MKFLDLFAGIGGFRMGLEMAGHQAVGYIEWDKFAKKSYQAIYDTKGEFDWDDITTVDYRRLPKADMWVFGFPCQDISVAGKQQGFKGNRSSLFFRVTELLRKTKEWDSNRLPSYLLIENVKNFFSINQGWDFFAAQVELDEIGYNVEWQLLNSKDFGVPQNRERVFIVGHLRGRGERKVFPITATNGKTNLSIEIIAHRENYRRNTQVFSPNGITETLDTGQGGGRGHYTIVPAKLNKMPNGKLCSMYEAGITDIGTNTASTVTSRYYKGIGGHKDNLVLAVLTPKRTEKRQDGRRFKEPGEPMFTLTSQDRHGVMLLGNVNPSGNGMNGNVYDGIGLSPTITTNKGEGIKINDTYRIRRLTPRETWRLQGFPDWAFDKAAEVNSDTQLYKQAGNAVTVNVAYEIGKKL